MTEKKAAITVAVVEGFHASLADDDDNDDAAPAPAPADAAFAEEDGKLLLLPDFAPVLNATTYSAKALKTGAMESVATKRRAVLDTSVDAQLTTARAAKHHT